ncbi:MAG: tripartite tricarboxylate transporter TctB family protein [Rhizobiales bacterium]|nr:tripartite tricarboxylate transporter TctB family protein [Hyphomicrobiales bacterium]
MRIRSPQNLVAGLALIAIAVFAIWLVGDLSQGSLRVIGPAMMPRWVAVIIGVAGLIFVAAGLMADGAPLERWHLRGPFFICVGMILFAMTIRTLGFLVAGPLTMMLVGYGTSEVRKLELIIFSAAMTAFCLVLFVYILDQPIPVLRIPGTSIRF